jgi:ubiquinone/menaquinone biosynthesis C-methylase UbiE|tara:strand:+ start:129 stop:677 length:549 start_codon:yes stop_codon:yes gene_type:complete
LTKKILKFVDELKFKNGAKVLELGYGAGQTALKLGQRGFEVHGVDLSEKLIGLAKQRCLKNFPEEKIFFKIGNLDSKLDYEGEKFDLVVIVGVLQYLYDPNVCLKEVYRVLKPGGYLINTQLNTFRLNQFISVRKFLVTCVHFVLNEKHALYPSFRTIIVDSKLGILFKRFEKSKLQTQNSC